MPKSNRTGVCFALAFLSLAAPAVPPACADVTVTASTGTGVAYGLAREIVYDTYAGKSYVLSELDWDLKPLVYAKGNLEIDTSIGFTASLGVRLGIPMKTGLTEDSDWLNYAFNGDTIKTNYSRSDCYTERAILMDTQVGWDLQLADWIALEPFLSFGLMDFQWAARDGYFQYPPGYPAAPLPYPDSATDPVKPISGTSVIYQQTYFIPAFGLSAKLRFGRSFAGTVSFAVSPWVFCNDVDNHEFGGQNFYDAMAYGLLLEPKVALDWQVSGRVRLSLDVSYRSISGLVGDTTVVKIGIPSTPGLVSATYPGGAGAAFDALDASLNVVWTL
jgi:outer membrane protease